MIVAPGLQQPVEHADQRCHIKGVQARPRLIEDVQHAALAGAQPRGDPRPLGLASRQGWRRLGESQVAQADLSDRPELCRDRRPVGEPLQCVEHAEAEYVGDAEAVDLNGQRGVVEAGALAGRARDSDVG